MPKSALSRAALIGLLLVAPAMASAERITVFAASSLTNAMSEVASRFEAATGHDVTVSLAGSSALARQIERGAPADIFISANADWMDRLEAGGLVQDGTRFDLLSNSIVLIASGTDAAPDAGGPRKGRPGTGAPATNRPATNRPDTIGPDTVGPDTDLAGLLGDGRLAMALVDAVPAGLYGKAALQSLGLWDSVAPQVAQAANVRAALAFVATGEAPYGIVYATDAAAEDRVTVAGTFPPDTHPPVLYIAAALTESRNPLNATFLAFLRGPEARAVFEDAGFGPAER